MVDSRNHSVDAPKAPAAMSKHRHSTGSSGVRTTAIVIAVIAVLYLAREILVPLALAITLALILTPAVDWLRRIRFGQVPAVALVMIVSIAIGGGVGWVIFNQLVGVANELPRYRQNIHNKLEAMRAPGQGAVGRASTSIKELATEVMSVAPPVSTVRGDRPQPVRIVDQPSNELEHLRDLAQPFLRPVGEFGMVLIFTAFLLIHQKDLHDRFFRLVGLNQLNLMTQALDDATSRVSRYLLMQLLVNLCFGGLCVIGLYLIGIPYAPLWGSVAGILRIVPYAGAVISGLLPFTLALAVFDNWLPPVLVFLLFAALELVTSNFVEPWLYGMQTGISSLALLLSAVFWTVLWGPAGLILSTPLTVCVVVLGRYVPEFSFLHVLLGDESVLAAEARFYQRLLAMDDQEARAVAGLYVTENSLSQLYDTVIIPALTMAEQDRHKGALDPTREQFVFMSVREMVVEFSERTLQAEILLASGAIKKKSPEAPPGRVFCIPASDEADEITAAMLAQLLEQSGYSAVSLPRDAITQHVIELLKPEENDTFCISALPPFAFARARSLSRELQQRFPGVKVMVGVWGFTGDTERAMQRFRPSPPDKLVTSLAGAVQFVVDPDSATGASAAGAAILEASLTPSPESSPAHAPTPAQEA
jgi:predicted PurR-regulated permease PerM